MKQLLLVFLGGGLGSALRYIVSKSLNPIFDNFYLGTFAVNILGCLIIGFLFGFALKENYLSQNHMLFLATGFCGGFTTFSAFALEQNELLRTGQLTNFLIYLVASIICGVLAVLLGLWVSKVI
jgi:CrcB protein